jgi:hypothetical protein
MGDQNEFHVHDTPPGTSVIPDVWAARLEALGLVELLAGMPDFAHHQRVRWLVDGFDHLHERTVPTVTESLAEIAFTLGEIKTLLANGYATVHVTSQRDPL